MADDNTNGQSEGGSSSFGEVAEREEVVGEDGGKPVLVADKVKDQAGEGQTEGAEGEGETQTEGETETGKKPELTEKGTKLDPNPQSAVHQELANERKVRSNYERVLADPKLLAQFMETQYHIKVPVAPAAGEETATTEPVVKEYKPEDFQNLEDVAGVVNGLQKSFVEARKLDSQKIQELTTTVQGLLQGGRQQQVNSKLTTEIGDLQKLPELTEGNPDFIKGLEERITKAYHQLDFDVSTGTYKGEHDLLKIAQDYIDIAKESRAQGSQKAQTIVKDKSRGAVKTSEAEEGEPDTAKLTAGDSIALGISKKFGK
jgi:hypothetical protein